MDGFPPSLAAPAAGDLVPPTGTLFSWLPDPRATSYKFERRKPNDPTNAVVETVATRATAWAPTSTLPAGTAQWRVTALDTAGKDLGSSPWREFVVVDPPAVATPVTISGSGRVGTELRVAAPTFDPVAETTTYQWYRGTSRITGATGETYTLVPADLGKQMSVEATGLLTGYKNATSRSGDILAVSGDALVAIVNPTIDGDAYIGRSLTTVPGTWPDTPAVTRQWHRDGVAISGATKTTYLLAPADLGHDITVAETAKKTGYADGKATSAPVTPTAPPALAATRRPSIDGDAYVGRSLTAVPGIWPETPSVTRQCTETASPSAVPPGPPTASPRPTPPTTSPSSRPRRRPPGRRDLVERGGDGQRRRRSSPRPLRPSPARRGWACSSRRFRHVERVVSPLHLQVVPQRHSDHGCHTVDLHAGRRGRGPPCARRSDRDGVRLLGR